MEKPLEETSSFCDISFGVAGRLTSVAAVTSSSSGTCMHTDYLRHFGSTWVSHTSWLRAAHICTALCKLCSALPSHIHTTHSNLWPGIHARYSAMGVSSTCAQHCSYYITTTRFSSTSHGGLGGVCNSCLLRIEMLSLWPMAKFKSRG